MARLTLILAAIGFLLAANAYAGEKAVTFPTTGGLQLAGTVRTPDGPPPAGGWGAVVLIQGSGPTDRDGNSRLIPQKIDLLKQLADVLADCGVVTLRYDKRGMYGNKDQMPKDPAKQAEFFDWDRFVDDATAAYHFVGQYEHVDPKRVGILGHSEGGTLALLVADRTKSEPHPPAVLLLLGTMGRPEDQVLEDQLKRVMTAQKATAAQQKPILDNNRQVCDEIKKSGKVPDDVMPAIAAMYPKYLGPFLKGAMSVDGAALAAAYPGPVLVLNGENDTQVSAKLDAALLDEKLKTRKGDDHTFKVIPAASHNFKHAEKDQPGFEGPVVPEAVDAIREWVRVKLVGKN